MADLTRLGTYLTRQAVACAELGSPMYEALLHRMVDHLGVDGPLRRVLEPSAGAAGPDAIGLRLLGTVHRLVLERRAGRLAAYYPSVGGVFDLDLAWPAFLDVLDREDADVLEGMRRPPQTNEVGRAAALIGGLLLVRADPSLPVRLFELGSSAGLNLRADRFRYVGANESWGPPDSPVRLDPAWTGAPIGRGGPLDVVERLGCDPDPVDPTSTEGRLLITSYVWPDQPARLERLRAAFAVADEVPATVRRQRAGDFVSGVVLVPGTWTVLWHSVMWQYLDTEEKRTVLGVIGRLGATASPETPVSHLFLEPWRRTADTPHDFLVVAETWPGGVRRVLGSAPGHGIPVVWER